MLTHGNILKKWWWKLSYLAEWNSHLNFHVECYKLGHSAAKFKFKFKLDIWKKIRLQLKTNLNFYCAILIATQNMLYWKPKKKLKFKRLKYLYSTIYYRKECTINCRRRISKRSNSLPCKKSNQTWIRIKLNLLHMKMKHKMLVSIWHDLHGSALRVS